MSNQNCRTKIQTVRLTARAETILKTQPQKEGVTTNRFINECIEAHRSSSSKQKKENHTKRVKTMTYIYLLKNSKEYHELPETVKHTIDQMERTIDDHGNSNYESKRPSEKKI